MRLRELIGQIDATSNRLRQAEDEFTQWIPSDHVVVGDSGDGEPPRIAFLHPKETTTTRHGMFVAYLFAADGRTVTLTLNQGAGEMAEHLGRAKARKVLSLQAAAIRAALRAKEIAGLDATFALHAKAEQSVDFEHANIVSRTYRLDKLPAESKMVNDLRRFIKLHAQALEAREAARRQGRHEFVIPAVPAAPETPDEPRKSRVLTGAMARRGVLAALILAPVAYAAPRAGAFWNEESVTESTETTESILPPQTAPVFTIDVSQHDWSRRGGNLDWTAVHRAGIAGMCARATYGDPAGYQWPTHHFGSYARSAKRVGMTLRGGYHNLVRGDQASINRQVDWLRRELDRYEANWAMLDVERYGELVKSDMWPRWDDARRFDDRWAEVDSRVLVGYIPPWNWSQHLGQPDLRDFRGPLIASNYPREVSENFKEHYAAIGAGSGRGWASYGNRVPDGWQYTSKARVPGASHHTDVNAWRMTFEGLKALLIG